MNIVIILFTILFSTLVQANCLGEAQIIAKVDRIIERHDMISCKVAIDPNSIIQYNVNMTCPLDLSEVLAEGVEVGMPYGHDCAYNEGDTLSGVIVKRSWGSLDLE